MQSITPYLFFPGNCEEAMNFYKKVFNAEITSLQRFGDASMPVTDEYREKIMHGELTIGSITMMFSDGAPHREITNGDNVHLNLSFDNETSLRLTWGKLTEEGSIHMDLQDTFWGALFGQLEDKYGIRWMLNYQREE
ncbi:MAG: VOC family protein [Balneolaceae bacterium]|nr:VOC family protein [Balneolaceae bacterium]